MMGQTLSNMPGRQPVCVRVCACMRVRARMCVCLVAVLVLAWLLIYGSLLGQDSPTRLHQAFLLSQHVRSYPVLHRPRACPPPAALLLAVKSLPSHMEQRAAVRGTWGQERRIGGRDVRRVFLLGQMGDEDAAVDAESHRYGDILQWDFRDSFFNVTLKEVLFWRWFQEECSASYVLKADDDVFVDVGGVLVLIGHHRPGPSHPLYLGRAFVDTYPVRLWWNKYYVPASLYPAKPYPPYMGGGGYLVSQETIRKLLVASASMPMFPIDGVYVGMCAQAANVSATHHPAFMPFEFSPSLPPCTYLGLLVIHRLEPGQIHQLWSFYTSQAHTCPPVTPAPTL
ncbi:hypothetical protein AGOR_G00187030 [Albula goreensis]|uniref:Hexosyltransferase n=1 Tax=Albula goreensis TaxID=1534307 RepID=A0A8T3CXZ8_9TELE|nr:hypothetical protein AGOR_G00187030 [Albula goreensis]